MKPATNIGEYSTPLQDQNDNDGRHAPVLDWRGMKPSDHFVQFYESDAVLVDAVSGFIGAGLDQGEGCIVIATQPHREAIEAKLTAHGLVLAQAQYVALDAAETLSCIMFAGSPEPHCFRETVGRLVAQAAEGGRPVRVFGEMVSLLWSEGNQAAAIRLEGLWNELAETQAFCLFCAYSLKDFDREAMILPFTEICTQHSCVIPAESYSALSDPDQRLREISLLQQKAKVLEAELAYRKEVEKTLSQRERELSDFFENAIEGLHKVDPDGTILWANKAELELLGYQPDEYIGHSITEFHVDRDVIEEMLAKLLRGEILYNYPAQLRCKDGSIKDVLIHSNAYFEKGKLLHTRCFTHDVTHLKQVEFVQSRLAAVVDSSDDAIISKTLEAIITSWNKGAERIFGYTAEEIIGKSKTLLFPPDRLAEEDEILTKLRRGERIEHFESVRVRKDGVLIDVSLTISPIRDSQGTIIGASTIARDITQARRQQRELVVLNAHLKRLMTETHHRVKNNLQVIAAMIEMQSLEHQGSDTIPLEEFMHLKSHVCTLAIVHDLLTKSLKETEETQRISVKAVLEQLLPMLQQTAWNRTVHFEIADAAIPSKQCISLALVLNELVSNALKHGKGAVQVTFAAQDGRALLEVCDDGPGFPKDFDPIASANTGLELIESLVRTDLAGLARYENRTQGGGRVRVTFALPDPTL